eukprot:TRINITY_DN8734_c1_g1_i1.p1 TRINITY_DN8734_c1_g1~~TRINITY_DN8734_c1_g1_i1.p1  ORF type:complete len:699 (+),score=129.87 TRINITY_DN8734_c1_g1_i1:115-2211(+)
MHIARVLVAVCAAAVAAAQGLEPEPGDDATQGGVEESTVFGTADEDCVLPSTQGDRGSPDWIWRGGFLLIGMVTALSFWGLAEVTEHHFVPALSVLCAHFRIPNNVAGATIMAAGGCSPELFSSLISIFVTKSQIGAGTIVGSAVFNHLVICAVSVLACPGGELALSGCVVVRDAAFYAVSLLLLLFAVSEVGKGTTASGKPCNGFVHVYWYQAALMCLGYLLYILVCAVQKRVVAQCCPALAPEDDKHATEEELVAELDSPEHAAAEDAHRNGCCRSTCCPAAYLSLWEKPSPGVCDDMIHPDPSTLSLWLHKQSRFYTGLRISSQAWQHRWFTIDERGMRSCRDRLHPREHLRCFNLFECMTPPEVDTEKLTLEIDLGRRQRDLPGATRGYYGLVVLRANSRDALTRLVVAINLRRAAFSELPPSVRRERWAACLTAPPPCAGGLSDLVEEETTGLHHVMPPVSPLSDAPAAAASVEFMSIRSEFEEKVSACERVQMVLRCVWWAATRPLGVFFNVSIPKVTEWGPRVGVSIFCCTCWIALLSFAMTMCLEMIGGLLGVPAVVMGLTAGAVGTSFPNAWGSYVVARQGLGDMAISNALGSNVFTILVGLGVPWLAVTVVAADDANVNRDLRMYHGMASGGVVFPTAVLLVLLMLFMVMLCCTGMRLNTVHAWGLLVVYVGFLVWAILTKCAAPPPF